MIDIPGLNYQLGDDVDALREAVRNFVAKELTPRAADIDRDNLFPADMWKKLGDLGIIGRPCLKNMAAPTWAMWPTWWRWKKSAGAAPQSA